jgi:hypothetical protein
MWIRSALIPRPNQRTKSRGVLLSKGSFDRVFFGWSAQASNRTKETMSAPLLSLVSPVFRYDWEAQDTTVQSTRIVLRIRSTLALTSSH